MGYALRRVPVLAARTPRARACGPVPGLQTRTRPPVPAPALASATWHKTKEGGLGAAFFLFLFDARPLASIFPTAASGRARAGFLEERLHLVGFQRLLLQQRLGKRAHRLHVALDDPPRVIVAADHHLADFFVDALR